jgi:hypothetical protein
MKSAKNANKKKLNHHADILNNNGGASGTNIANVKMHGNRGKQLNPNQSGQALKNRFGQASPKGRVK